MRLENEELTGTVINAFFKVYNTLGYGFLEKVYENALLLELRSRGIHCLSQYPVKVHYNNVEVGFYIADIIINDILIIEIKAAEGLCPEHDAQLINYLRATDLQIGLLLNFGKSPQFKRKIVSRVLNKSQFNTSA